MNPRNRRQFLADVGKGMLVASVGSGLAVDLGLTALADEDPGPLNFGSKERLACLMQETPVKGLLPVIASQLKSGTDLRSLVAAAALANARTFGGQDYTGYHALMALAPSFQMASELPTQLQPLPVMKVLYRNTDRIQSVGGRKSEKLRPVRAADLPPGKRNGEALREATRSADMDRAESTFAALAKGPLGEAFNHLQFAIEDEVDVHRVVLAWRSWVLLDFTGQDQARNLLRQSVRYCVDAERNLAASKRSPCAIRTLLPKLLDQYRLLSQRVVGPEADDGWIEHLSNTIYGAGRERAAEAVAAALAEGMSPDCIGEAISLAANRLVLCDPGRTRAEPGKPIGSVHGASVGVHASDSANAWRNIARVSNHRNTAASLIVGAYHTAGQDRGQSQEPYPLPAELEKVKSGDPAELLRETEAAIKEKNQARAAALVQHYGSLGHSPRPVFDLLLRYGVSEDGALHAEKYYRTVTEEFAATRPSYRWRHLVALARVTASEYGFPAPGYAEARRLLSV